MTEPRLDTLRRALHEFDAGGDKTAEMLEVAAIVQEAVEPAGVRPVVVGGLALASWVAGDVYLTADIDVVMPYSPTVDGILEALGFSRDGRHWVLEERGIVYEAPGSTLRPDRDDYEEVRLPSGRTVLVQSPEGVLLIRMEELPGTPRADGFEQCLFLLGSGEIDDAKVTDRARELSLLPLLRWLREQADAVRAGTDLPESWEIAEKVKELT